MAMSMSQVAQLNGMGNAAALVASVTGPLSQAGSDVYRTYEEGRLSKAELKQRQREFQQLIPLYASQQRQDALLAIADVRRAQVRAGYQAAYAPYLLAAVLIGGLTLAAIAASKGG